MSLRMFFVLLTLVLTGSPSVAEEMSKKTLHVAHGWARESIGAGANGVAFVVVHNPTDQEDRLVSLSSSAAEKTEIHTHEKSTDGIMSMVHVPELDVPAGAHIEFQPGGLHIMLIGLAQPLKPDETVEIEFVFEHAGALSLEVPVLSLMDSMERAEKGHAHNQHHGD